MLRCSLALLMVTLTLAGCTDTGDEDTGAPGDSITTTVNTTTVAEPTPTTTTVAPTTTTTSEAPTTTSTTSTTTTTTTTLPPVTDVAAGLFCRDLVALGYDYADAITYWVKEGSPDRMDADRNGIPCETVYASADVLAFWGDPLPTTTQVTIVYAPGDPVAFPAVLAGSDNAHGSGCAPGSDALPDGVWFGYVTGRSSTRIDFDLACIWTGAAAVTAAAEDGVTLEIDYYVRNQSGKIRSPRVADGATVYHLTGNPWFTEMSYADWRQGACNGIGDPACPVWLYVNGGRVTAIVEQYFA